ncbi:expressed unknown protein [Seminavis robusta]|uniref:Uncharacterized protein n=1 Tax=Seminavis robusta TaxID=568900 RepID=A0A9N8HBZ2_9STRA|nr:expressed unknown protein [Seminavis robusta]|eukprot:Sro357_g125580.1 n/a (273) ;mRNA; f:23685-24503
MTASMLIYPAVEPMSLHFSNSISTSDEGLFDFDPLPLDASDNGSSSDLRIFTDLFLLNDDTCKSSTRKRPRRVSFQEEPTEVINVPSFANLAEEERRGLWYRHGEIERFRSVARHACRALRKNPAAYPADITRGLELRTSLDRQYRKHLALAAIIKAQVRYPQIDPLHLAAIANRCTELPRQEAVEQGTRDFCDAYFSNNNNDMGIIAAPAVTNIPLSSAPPTPAAPLRCLSRLNKRHPSMLSSSESFQEAPVAKRRRCIPSNSLPTTIFFY